MPKHAAKATGMGVSRHLPYNRVYIKKPKFTHFNGKYWVYYKINE